MQLVAVPIEKPDDLNVIVGQAHFIKTVEDLHEALVGSSAIRHPERRSGDPGSPMRRVENEDHAAALAVHLDHAHDLASRGLHSAASAVPIGAPSPVHGSGPISA